jgi:hypothetical protein
VGGEGAGDGDQHDDDLAGPLTLAQDALRALGDPDQTLITYTAEPGSPAQASLRLLASWQATPAASTDRS